MRTCNKCNEEFEQTPSQVKNRGYTCNKCGAERKKTPAYRETDRIREKAKYASSSEFRDRKLVRSKVRTAIKSGRLTRKPCEVCGTINSIDAHHDDYSKPLDVRWLCQKHHREHHRTVQLKS